MDISRFVTYKSYLNLEAGNADDSLAQSSNDFCDFCEDLSRMSQQEVENSDDTNVCMSSTMWITLYQTIKNISLVFCVVCQGACSNYINLN